MTQSPSALAQVLRDLRDSDLFVIADDLDTDGVRAYAAKAKPAPTGKVKPGPFRKAKLALPIKTVTVHRDHQTFRQRYHVASGVPLQHNFPDKPGTHGEDGLYTAEDALDAARTGQPVLPPKDDKPDHRVVALAHQKAKTGWYQHADTTATYTRADAMLKDYQRMPLMKDGDADATTFLPAKFAVTGEKNKAAVPVFTIQTMPGLPPINTKSSQMVSLIAAQTMPLVQDELKVQDDLRARKPEALSRDALLFATLSANTGFDANMDNHLNMIEMMRHMGGGSTEAGWQALQDLVAGTGTQTVMGLDGNGKPKPYDIPEPKVLDVLNHHLLATGNPIYRDEAGEPLPNPYLRRLVQTTGGANANAFLRGMARNTEAYDQGRILQAAQAIGQGHKARSKVIEPYMMIKHKTGSFWSHLFDQNGDVVTVDRHMMSVLDAAYGGPGYSSALASSAYPVVEEWFRQNFAHHFPEHTTPFARQWSTWNAVYGMHVPHRAIFDLADGHDVQGVREGLKKQRAATRTMIDAQIAHQKGDK